MHISWESVSAVSSVIATVLVIVAAVIALRQFRESISVRQLQSILGFIEQFQSSSVRSMRGFLIKHRAEITELLEEPGGVERLDGYLQRQGALSGSPASVAELRQNLAVLEFIAVLSLNNKVPDNLERAYLAPTIIGYWQAVRPVVCAIRAVPGEELYLQHLESLIHLAASGNLYGRRAQRAKRQELRRLIKKGQMAVALQTEGHDSKTALRTPVDIEQRVEPDGLTEKPEADTR